MPPRYQFMTGATLYRLEAASLDQALQMILNEFKPTKDAEAVIRSTLRELIDHPASPSSGSDDSDE